MRLRPDRLGRIRHGRGGGHSGRLARLLSCQELRDLHLLPALFHGPGQRPYDQPAGPNGVVVPRDQIVDLIGIAVGVHETYERDPQLVDFFGGDGLTLRVGHKDGGR
jgi:hypothetical protein